MEIEKEKPKRRKLITVRIIEQRGPSALIEWNVDDDIRRAFVPADTIEGDKCDGEIVEAGVPYGIPWEELADISSITPEAIGKEMRRRGLWTADDMERNMQKVSKAIAVIISPVIISLRRAAKNREV